MPSSPAALAAFRDFLEFVLAKYFRKNHEAMAAAVGIDVRSLRRTLKPDEGKHTFSLEHCLNLAKAIHADASYVLRKADKGGQAELIEGLYGRAQLSDAFEELLAAWQRLDGSDQKRFLKAAQQWAEISVLARAPRIGAPDPPPPAKAINPRARKKR